MILNELQIAGYERVIAFSDAATGLHGFLAIHSTTLGPAVGGTRVWSYSNEEDALADALRLSRAMTYKAALAELPVGGGKAVIVSHAGLKRAAGFEGFGEFVESLGGRFRTGPDLGVTDEDLSAMARTTRYVTHESAPGQGDISEATALGVWHGMRACLEFSGLTRARVAIQGAGHVGRALGRILKQEGMELLVADIDPARAQQAQEEFGAEMVAPEDILTVACDVFAPCALGGVVSVETARRIQARIVCGCANNVLATPEAGEALARRGILYAPDYLVNAGGLIRGVEFEFLGRADSTPSLERIYDRMREVLQRARERRLPTARVADGLAEARLAAAGSVARERPAERS